MKALKLFNRPTPLSEAEISESVGMARFPFLQKLEDEVGDLLSVTTADKLNAFEAAAEFLASNHDIQREIVEALAATGYPRSSAQYELSLLASFLARDRLETIAANPAALHGGTKWLDGDFTELNPNIFVTGFPIGPLLIVGSGNSAMPAIVSAVESLLANCPVALRGSRVNQMALERLLCGLRVAGDSTLSHLIAKVHLFFLDHQDPNEARLFGWLLRHGAFAAGNFWGGQQALDFLISEFARNPRHPRIIPMEPMTGVAVISQQHVSSDEILRWAKRLAEAMLVMGQQLCSSPTEAYFIGDAESAITFARETASELERASAPEACHIGEAQAFLLDRIRSQFEEAGSIVITPHAQDAKWTLAVSRLESSFKRISSSCSLPIHQRSGFLELIVVGSLDAAASQIRALPAAPCHRGIKQVQTILRFMSVSEAKELWLRLRTAGIYRMVPPEYVVLRHALEPLDGRHLISELTRQAIVF